MDWQPVKKQLITFYSKALGHGYLHNSTAIQEIAAHDTIQQAFISWYRFNKAHEQSVIQHSESHTL
jgi:hypothetical protein